jgi:hypothetical protein
MYLPRETAGLFLAWGCSHHCWSRWVASDSRIGEAVCCRSSAASFIQDDEFNVNYSNKGPRRCRATVWIEQA